MTDNRNNEAGDQTEDIVKNTETTSEEQPLELENADSDSKVRSLLLAREVRELEAQLKMRDLKIKELESKITDLDLKFLEARGFVKKMESEVEQIRLRTERDVQKMVDSKISDLVLQLLPVIDSFDLSARAIEEGRFTAESLAEGFALIQNQFADALRSLQIERIPAKGENFDPNLHDALMNEMVQHPDQEGKVVSELKAGYRMGDKVIRPAQVSVGVLSDSH